MRNAGDRALTIAGASIDGADADEFAVDDAVLGEIALGASVDVTIRSEPTRVGLLQAVLRIASDDPHERALEEALRARSVDSVDPNIRVEGGPLDFGNVIIGGSREREVSIHNDGSMIWRSPRSPSAGAIRKNFRSAPACPERSAPVKR